MMELRLWLCVCLLPLLSSAYPLCLNMEAPQPQPGLVNLCKAAEYTSRGCCNATDEELVHQQLLQSVNQSSTQCAVFIQQILCARCDPFAADLFGVAEQAGRTVPYLCTSGDSPYCSRVWEACANSSIPLFSPDLQQGSVASSTSPQPTTTPPLSAIFSTAPDFCTTFSRPADTHACFNGQPYQAHAEEREAAPGSICLHKVEQGAYLTLIPHPARADVAFLAAQSGQIWLASLPAQGDKDGGVMMVNRSAPFLDLSERVVDEGPSGLLGLALHPDFANNGRFFVSYICDKQKFDDCSGKCACNSQVQCDPSHLGFDAGAFPCRYSSVVAEFSAAASGQADPREKRRIFTMGLPYRNHHGGQILFGPLDAYLYLMLGDGGSAGDPYNFAQNKRSLLGKVLRLDVDGEGGGDGEWGSYVVPEDNPFVRQGEAKGEIWAMGLRNPWRCSFDSGNVVYLYCGDVGQDAFEEVDLISKGGNYGWRLFEGDSVYKASESSNGTFIAPVLEYSHSSNVSKAGSASITGGYVSRSASDPCVYGRYVYADLYGLMWLATEMPAGSGNYSSSKVTYQCAPSSPLPCHAAIQPIFSFGEDADRHLYILAYTGVYRLVHPSYCHMSCNESLPSSLLPSSKPSPPTSQPSPCAASTMEKRAMAAVLMNLVVLFIFFDF